MLSITNEEKIKSRQKLTLSIVLVFLMVSSTTLSMMTDFGDKEEVSTRFAISNGELLDKESVNLGQQPSGQGTLDNFDNHLPPQPHSALYDIMWTDSGIASGVINDSTGPLMPSVPKLMFMSKNYVSSAGPLIDDFLGFFFAFLVGGSFQSFGSLGLAPAIISSI